MGVEWEGAVSVYCIFLNREGVWGIEGVNGDSLV